MKKFKNMKIVLIGGGTGLSNIIMGLKKFNSQITAIVTVTDDGGSSGRLRKDYDIIPPGDIRNCLSALAEEDNIITELFSYRFGGFVQSMTLQSLRSSKHVRKLRVLEAYNFVHDSPQLWPYCARFVRNNPEHIFAVFEKPHSTKPVTCLVPISNSVVHSLGHKPTSKIILGVNNLP